MNQVIQLMQERNKYLAKFSALNIAETTRMIEGNFDRIDDFYIAREGILEIVKQIELMMEKHLSADSGVVAIAPSLRRMASDLLRERDELVNQILAQDLEILQLVDQAKNQIIQELQGLKRGRKVISSYKSGTPKQTIDEEA